MNVSSDLSNWPGTFWIDLAASFSDSAIYDMTEMRVEFRKVILTLAKPNGKCCYRILVHLAKGESIYNRTLMEFKRAEKLSSNYYGKKSVAIVQLSEINVLDEGEHIFELVDGFNFGVQRANHWWKDLYSKLDELRFTSLIG